MALAFPRRTLPTIFPRARASAVMAVEARSADATYSVRQRVTVEGSIRLYLARTASSAPPTASPARHLCRGVATAAGLRRAHASRRAHGEIEEVIVRIGFGEYLAQILGGIPMSQAESRASPISGFPRLLSRSASRPRSNR